MEDVLKQILNQIQDMQSNMQTMQSNMQTMQNSMQNMQNDINNMKQNMATKQDLSELEENMNQKFKTVNDKIDLLAAEGQKDVVAMIGLTNKKIDGLVAKADYERLETKVDQILATQTTQGESINILALRQLQTESEVAILKKAK